jgi:tetratricopeptide (TPR) repeat protein
MGNFVKRTAIHIIPVIVLFFLFSCASVTQQSVSSDAISSDSQGLASMKKGSSVKTASNNIAPGMNSLLAAAFNNLGMLSVEEGKYDQAISSFSKATEIDPRFTLAYNNRARAYIEKKDYDQAIRDLDKALEINPRYTAACFNRAVVYFLKGEYGQFKSDVTNAQQSIRISNSP